MNITEAVGKKVKHGSPALESEETIKQITFLMDGVEIEFESGAFASMSPGEFEHLMRYEELLYSERSHGGMSHIVFCDKGTPIQ